MRHACLFGSALTVSLSLAPVAQASTWYVSPTGTDTAACTRDTPCGLGAAASSAVAGDTVVLLDGVYQSQLWVKNSGTSSDWITFQADECATPIIEGKGIETDTDQPMGVGSNTANYIRFVGLVARGWNIGFGNGWIKDTAATISNGHIEYKYCIAEGNGRTGFTFFSAEGIHLQNCISAHNGSSVAHSWSSGIALFEAQGSNNVVEGCVSFENTDAQQHTDGSGFIADEHSNGASFVNNIAFRNGGSCMRVTVSSDVKFINNTCYHNAQDPLATGPDNPGEIYVTDEGSRTGMSVMNNTFYSTGKGPGAKAVFGQAAAGWSNNAVQDGGNVTVFSAPEGNNPDFTPSSSNNALIGKGASGNAVPTTDIGFDPKCIIKKAPTMIGDYVKADWWQFAVDIDYIKSIGGVGRCFRPKSRSGTPDIGAYANGGVTALPGNCTRSTGGAPSTGGVSSTGSAANTGGVPSSGGVAGNGGTTSGGTRSTSSAKTDLGGSSSNATSAVGGAYNSSINTSGNTTAMGVGGAANGGTTSSSGGASRSTIASTGGLANTSSGSAVGGNSATGNATSKTSIATSGNLGGNTALAVSGGESGSGCGCKIEDRSSRSDSLGPIGFITLAFLRLRRRKGARNSVRAFRASKHPTR